MGKGAGRAVGHGRSERVVITSGILQEAIEMCWEASMPSNDEAKKEAQLSAVVEEVQECAAANLRVDTLLNSGSLATQHEGGGYQKQGSLLFPHSTASFAACLQHGIDNAVGRRAEAQHPNE
jgi:hypothetical protein